MFICIILVTRSYSLVTLMHLHNYNVWLFVQCYTIPRVTMTFLLFKELSRMDERLKIEDLKQS